MRGRSIERKKEILRARQILAKSAEHIATERS